MYSYDWDPETGGYVLNSTPLAFSKEPRPVYYKELDLLGLGQYWNYIKSDIYPYMWAEANNYYYRGKLVMRVKGGAAFQKPEVILEEEPEPNGGRLRYVDIPAMIDKNREMIDTLASDTVKKIFNTYSEYKNKVDVFYVAFSGGKDSVVALDLVQRALPHNELAILVGDTKMECSDTYKVFDEIEEYAKSENIAFYRATSHLEPEYTWRQFGPPSQTMRWCCSVHKSAPQILLLRELTGNPHFRGMAFTGIRGDESASRAEYDDVSLGEKIRGQYSCHPLLEWNTAELFLYIYERDLILNPAYKMGNSRVGCLVCPMAAYKNMYFKEQCYGAGSDGARATTVFNDIILETTSKDLSSQEAIDEFMNIAGWKARRSGKELNIAKAYCDEALDKGILRVTLTQQNTDWREWIKTVGVTSFIDANSVEITYHDKVYRMTKEDYNGESTFTIPVITNTKNDIYFMSAVKTALRKSAYCIGCRVCEANCPNGYIKFNNGSVTVDDRCVHCLKCHDIQHGCLLADSLRIPKEEKSMGSVDRYGNMGIEYDWVRKYMDKQDEFWDSNHGLGTNMVKYLRAYLSDAGMLDKSKNINEFGTLVSNLGASDVNAWALQLCNLAYTSQFNWWIKNTEIGHSYTPDAIIAMLGEERSENSKSHVASAFKNIFISNQYLGTELGLGIPDYELKGGKRYINSILRSSWAEPDPRVVLYSLYKFAEACGSYYQFTLSRLLEHDIDSDGISPSEIFGISKDTMQKIVNGLAINYPDFISASFTFDLDNITLYSNKTSNDVLELF